MLLESLIAVGVLLLTQNDSPAHVKLVLNALCPGSSTVEWNSFDEIDLPSTIVGVIESNHGANRIVQYDKLEKVDGEIQLTSTITGLPAKYTPVAIQRSALRRLKTVSQVSQLIGQPSAVSNVTELFDVRYFSAFWHRFTVLDNGKVELFRVAAQFSDPVGLQADKSEPKIEKITVERIPLAYLRLDGKSQSERESGGPAERLNFFYELGDDSQLTSYFAKLSDYRTDPTYSFLEELVGGFESNRCRERTHLREFLNRGTSRATKWSSRNFEIAFLHCIEALKNLGDGGIPPELASLLLSSIGGGELDVPASEGRTYRINVDGNKSSITIHSGNTEFQRTQQQLKELLDGFLLNSFED